MNEYKVSDYGIFTNAINTVKTGITAVDTAGNMIKEAKTVLSSDSIFEGPAKDSCMEGITSVEGKLQTLITQFNSINTFIQSASDNYKAGDKAAENTVATVTDTPTPTTSTTTTAKTKDSKMSIPADPVVAEKKRQYIGDVDDPSQYTEYQGNNLFGRHNTLTLFDNKTGEVIQDHGTITMAPGETRVITVKLPTDTGMINQITRTTADGNAAYRSGKIVTAKSDIDPNPNNVEYVRLAEGGNGSYHQPSDMNLLHNNSYDWIITANREGKVTASQTCLWSSSMTKGRNLKGMINLNVEVKNNS